MEAVAVEREKSKRTRSPPPVRPIAVTVAEARRLSGLGTTKIYELIGSGALESRTIGKRRLIVFASLEKLLGV